MVRVKKYHQTREDRRHEAAGMRHHSSHRRGDSHERRRYHQTREDRRHESEGMRHRSHDDPRYHQTMMDRRHESEGMRGRHERREHQYRDYDRHDSHHDPRYHQTRMDRMHESEGMRGRHNPNPGREDVYKEGLDSRFMGMISEDHNAPSNLPQHEVHRYYPKSDFMDRYELDDTIHGVDENLSSGVRKLEDYPSTSMY